MKIAAVRVTPIAISDPPLLNASGVHEPYALRSIIEVETDNRDRRAGSRRRTRSDALAALHEEYLRCGITNRDDVSQMRKFRPDWTRVKPRF